MLVDDHEVVRDGVKALIESNDDLTVVAEAGSVKEAIAQAERTKPDVVVMDVRLADGSGIEATREIRARLEKTQVLMLTSFADDEALFASIMAGAAGYVLKQIRGGELIRAIREVGAGRSLLDPEVTRSVLDRLRKGKTMRDEKLARLSAQEERILTLVAKGQTNGQIGKELKLAEKTVKNYVSTILSKLEVARRAEAAAYLARHTTPPGSAGLRRPFRPRPASAPALLAQVFPIRSLRCSSPPWPGPPVRRSSRRPFSSSCWRERSARPGSTRPHHPFRCHPAAWAVRAEPRLASRRPRP